MRKIFIISIFLLSFSVFANAQAVPSYIYLEVLDSDQKPLSDVKIDCSRCERSIQTIGNKTILVGYFYLANNRITPRFTITKQDYFPFQDFGELSEKNIKVELLKIPKTKQERDILGNEQLKREFFSALQNNDLEKVRKFLKSGISPNLTTGDLRGISGFEPIPAIIFPAVLGNGAMIKMFLESGADIHKKDRYTPQILAYFFESPTLEGLRYKTPEEQAKIAKDYDEGLKALIKAKIDVNAKIDCWNPLRLAISAGMISSVKILIANGADVNAKTCYDETLIRFAQHFYYIANNEEIIKTLRNAGAKE